MDGDRGLALGAGQDGSAPDARCLGAEPHRSSCPGYGWSVIVPMATIAGAVAEVVVQRWRWGGTRRWGAPTKREDRCPGSPSSRSTPRARARGGGRRCLIAAGCSTSSQRSPGCTRRGTKGPTRSTSARKVSVIYLGDGSFAQSTSRAFTIIGRRRTAAPSQPSLGSRRVRR